MPVHVHVGIFLHSMTTCDEPVLADLGLETLNCRRYLRRVTWYCKMKHTVRTNGPFSAEVTPMWKSGYYSVNHA